MGRTALHFASWNGHADICRFLLQGPHSLNIISEAKSSISSRFTRADVNATSNDCSTALSIAAHHGHLAVCSVLLNTNL
ncbi:unnamed protein product [Protopolystoma xenopodis]|uniref:Uncharacterized protein n=1 Tax=Protopolystoma xenopodis TaxID=117903 RepID=A0A3S5CLI0_9PLAT|nr:unnamed protein product [Protopolystoma xenopodis]